MDALVGTETLQLNTLIIGLIGGLAIFLFGMEQMTDALKTVAGSRMQTMLRRLTADRFTAAGAGAFITALIQSSSVTTALVVGFVSAGLISLSQSVGVIIGANIGTTITAQIIAFKVTQYALILVAVGFLAMFTAKNQRSKQFGAAVMGLGMIFFGMELMSNATTPLRSYRPFIEFMQQIENPLSAILLSTLFTALIQSSSATTGVVIVLATQGFITLETGIALAFGANIGTCITALLAAVGKPREAVQAAVIHVLFNVIGVVIWFGFIDQLALFVRATSPGASNLVGMAKLAAETPRQIANAHTVFNIANTLIFIGFTTQLAALVQRLVPDRTVPDDVRMRARYLDNSVLDTPDLALNFTRLELGRLGDLASQMLWKALPAVVNGRQDDLNALAAMDSDVDTLHALIIGYLGKLSQESLLSRQTKRLYDYMAVANYIENIGDMVETNIVEAGNERLRTGLHMSLSTQNALNQLHKKICWSVTQALESVNHTDGTLAAEVIDAKAEINRLAAVIDSHLAQRLIANEPNRLEAFRVETDIIENFRRIYYFAKKIAKVVADSSADDIDILDRELKVDPLSA